MCMIDGCDPNELSFSAKRRARKEHKCSECRRTILPGESYQLNKALFDGCWNVNKVCSHCQVATEWLILNCHGYVTDMVREDIQEHIDEYRTVYKHTIRPLKVLDIGIGRGWKIKRGPRAGQLMRLPTLPPVIGEDLH